MGGSNYGQGSSREHAALVPMYLGVRCVIAKSFARIHAANLINAGILPLTFQNSVDYDAVAQGHRLTMERVEQALRAGEGEVLNQTTGRSFPVRCDLTPRQQAIVLVGGLLNYTKEGGQ